MLLEVFQKSVSLIFLKGQFLKDGVWIVRTKVKIGNSQEMAQKQTIPTRFLRMVIMIYLFDLDDSLTS